MYLGPLQISTISLFFEQPQTLLKLGRKLDARDNFIHSKAPAPCSANGSKITMAVALSDVSALLDLIGMSPEIAGNLHNLP